MGARIETDITAVADPVERFFAYARERHSVYLRREAGELAPWTVDTILRWHKFTNVFRELDRTTVWFAKHVRGPLRDRPEVLPATIVFRWFNRVATGEALFCQLGLLNKRTAFEVFMDDLDVRVLDYAIRAHCGDGPYVTGAYTINTLSAGLGKTKLEGVLNLIGQWFELHPDWRRVADEMVNGPQSPERAGEVPYTLEAFCAWCRSPCLGEFMTYEVACDLRHTALLARALDVNTWANLGPGARRGLNRIFRGLSGKAADKAIPLGAALGEMQALLARSRAPSYWPQRARQLGARGPAPERIATDSEVFVGPARLGTPAQQWPAWELREVEHTLCEYDKYMRVAEGTGHPRGRAPR